MNAPMLDPRRGRRQLLLVAAVFFLPIALAAGLALSGWVPAARSHGEPILPQENFAAIPVTLHDGALWPWKAATPQYTLLALAGPDCSNDCIATLDLLHRAQVGLNKSSDKLRLLYVGAAPQPAAADASGAQTVLAAWAQGRSDAPALQHFVPAARDSLTVILVAADGTAIVRYPPQPGLAPEQRVLQINKDLKRLFK